MLLTSVTEREGWRSLLSIIFSTYFLHSLAEETWLLQEGLAGCLYLILIYLMISDRCFHQSCQTPFFGSYLMVLTSHRSRVMPQAAQHSYWSSEHLTEEAVRYEDGWYEDGSTNRLQSSGLKLRQFLVTSVSFGSAPLLPFNFIALREKQFNVHRKSNLSIPNKNIAIYEIS